MPEPLARRGFRVAADLVWRRRGAGVRQLEANLARVRPELDADELRRLSRSGMRSYLRYYCDGFRIRRWSPRHLADHVRVEGDVFVRAHLATGKPIVVGLAHSGNWDAAGAWSARHLAHVVSVAERLEPASVFADFLSFREGLGMTILPLERDGSTFKSLVRATRGPVLATLLCDRDLAGSGEIVQLFGGAARVASGPAALALALGAPLVAAHIHYERVERERRFPRCRGKGAWRMAIVFSPPIDPDVGRTSREAATPAGPSRAARRRERVAGMTQGLIDELARGIHDWPEDWHMLQPIFLDDLERARAPTDTR